MRSPSAELLDRLFALESFGIKLGLENISTLSAALGHPERSFPSVHVAGTNGKGSVAAMIHAALAAAGMRAGRYVSPHLVALNERFVIGAHPVEDAELHAVASDVLDCADRLRDSGELAVYPTFFEATTAIAFELFRRARVEVAVIEVGLGGRFDSTNIVRAPVGAITSIGFDHQQFLGESLEAIAFEKAGIIKPGMTVVTGDIPDGARQVVSVVAEEQGARIVSAREGIEVAAELRDGRTTVDMSTPASHYGPITLALRGEHQIGNAIVAVRTLEAARAHGIVVDAPAIERGLSEVEWPGRLELIEIPQGRVLLDGAHNVDGARALATYLRRWHSERPALVLGVMRDKDVRDMVAALLPAVSMVIATAANTPRAIPASELASRIEAYDPTFSVYAEADPAAAVERAIASNATVCVAGSIYLVGQVRDAIRQRAILR
jgi:dihydrofolate synthase/folylpolyglutamate synthase